MNEPLEIQSPAMPVAPPRRAGRFSTLREAVAGSHQDFTECSIRRAIFMLAVPMVLEMAMESLFAIINVFWVSHLKAGAMESVAAIGITESMLTLVFAVAMGLSMATTAMVARRTGEKDPAGAAVAAVQAIAIGIAIAVPIGLIGIFFAPQLFHAMGASPEVLAAGTGYARIIYG